jgi:putative ABC transport system ATP-binding protein
MRKSPYLVEINNLYYDIADVSLFNNLNLTITANTSVAILGRSGIGKTTLLSLIAGIQQAKKGGILLDGINLSTADETTRCAIRRTQLGMIFQDFKLLPNFTTLDNIAMPLFINKAPHAREHAAHLLEKVGLQDKAKQFPPLLSGGEQQRVAIARAFAIRPKLLLVDEPTGNLDDATASTIIELFHTIQTEYKMTMIAVTHDKNMANICSHKYNLTNKQLIQDKANVN